MQLKNPFTNDEIYYDIESLRNTDVKGYYYRPLGQLYLGIVPTEAHLKNIKIDHIINSDNNNDLGSKILVLEEIDLSPARLIDFLINNRGIRETGAYQTYSNCNLTMTGFKTALLAGCIQPSSINSLIRMLDSVGYKGDITVIEKSPTIVKMLRNNLDSCKDIEIKLIVGDALNTTNHYDLIFCDVLGHYLSDYEFKVSFPKMLSMLKKGGLAFIADMNELLDVHNKLTRTSGLKNALHTYEENFKQWMLADSEIILDDRDILQIRSRLFQEDTGHRLRSGLLKRYCKMLPFLSLIRSVAVTSKSYIEIRDDRESVQRYFDYMLFQKVV